MDELEGVLALPPHLAELLLGAAYDAAATVVLTAGSKGLLRGYSFRLSSSLELHFETVLAMSLSSSPTSAKENPLHRVLDLQLLPHTGQVLAVTADRALYFFNMYVRPSALSHWLR